MVFLGQFFGKAGEAIAVKSKIIRTDRELKSF